MSSEIMDEEVVGRTLKYREALVTCGRNPVTEGVLIYVRKVGDRLHIAQPR
jgi:hypothetical protein